MSDETGCDLPDGEDVTAGEAEPLERLLDRLLCDDASVDPAEVERGFGAASDGVDTVLEGAARVGATPREHSIGPYRLLGELGHGGQGVVYLARDERLGREVALKLIPDALTFSSASRLRFEREAEILAQLDHPGICTVYEVGEADGVPFIAMQRVRGESLAEKIRRTRELAPEEATTSSCVLLDATASPTTATEPPSGPSRTTHRAEILAICRLVESAARALHTAHEAGLIHRDVKPGNIMVKEDGEPVILDFGLAKEEHSGPELTQTGAAVGTPAYMSPEQLSRHAVALDRRTDVYGLGVTLFECLTGVQPFRGPTREALYRAILDEAPADARRLNPTLSRDLLVVIATAMARNRDDRYGTMLELAEDLRRIRAIEPITARPAGPTKRLTRWVQRNPVAAALTATAFLSLAAAAAIFAWKSNEVAKKNTALTAAVLQRDESNDELRKRSEELAAALARFTRHRDVRRLEVLRQRARLLYRGKPEDAPELRRWLREADELLARLDVHRKNLAELEAAAGPYDEDLKEEEYPRQWRELMTTRERIRELEAEIGDAAAEEARAPLSKELELARERARWLEEQIEVRTSWGLDFEDEWRFDLLRDLVGKLEHFARSPGLIDFMRDRLHVAENIVMRTLDDHADAWRAAAARVADDPRYGGLELRPQLGLIPLGPDPESGLEEFLHWGSHDWSGAGGALPARDEEERFEIAPHVGIILVLVPAGTFPMGAQREDPDGLGFEADAMENESPVREVALDAFFISKFEMTRAQWVRCVPNRRDPGAVAEGIGPVHPVDSVSWEMAYHVVVPAGLTLPTEAQWERAARADEHLVFPGEERIEDLLVIANLAGAERGERGALTPAHRDDFVLLAPVGSFEPNAFGLHDMAGNVSEWCWDFGESYSSAMMPGSGERASLPTRRAHRGGSFASAAAAARIAARHSAKKDYTAVTLGLRPARPLATD